MQIPTDTEHIRHDGFHLRQFVLLLLEDVDQRERKDAQHVDRQRDQEEEEEPIVPPADAVVHPRAVVIEGLFFYNERKLRLIKKFLADSKRSYLDAVIAHGTVRTPWRSVELTRHAPFHPHRDAVDLGILVQRGPELVLAIFVRWGCKAKQNIRIQFCCFFFQSNGHKHKVNRDHWLIALTPLAMCMHSTQQSQMQMRR